MKRQEEEVKERWKQYINTGIKKIEQSDSQCGGRVTMQDKQYVLSISYGKDSLACLGAIEKLGLPLDRIIHAEVWATKNISADLPPMMEFKKKADQIIKDRWGIEVEHFKSGITYEEGFYKTFNEGTKHCGGIYGFPLTMGAWCNSRLKVSALTKAQKSTEGCISYIGIAEDEPERLARLDGVTKISPLHLIGWTEADAMQWCIENNLKSPTYDDSTRGGCWFCHNQSVQQLRLLRNNYPELWAKMLKWDEDSPRPFHADGRTVHDFDERFRLEDEGIVSATDRWKWDYLKCPPCRQLSLFEDN